MSSTVPTGKLSRALASIQKRSPDTTVPSQTDKSVSLDDLQNSKDAEELAAWVRKIYQDMKSSRNRIQLQWALNLSMYYGNQYMDLLPKLNKLAAPPVPRHRVRMIVNRIRPAIRTELARLTSQRPSATVIPASSDDEDMFAAYAGEQVWESITSSSHADLKRHFKQTVFWTVITGNGFLKTWWDPEKLDLDNNIKGDICYGAVTPFHLFVPDLREQNIQDQPYLLNAYTKPVEWVKSYYGKDLVVNPDSSGSNEILDDVYLGLNASSSTEPDSVLCMEVWVKPGGHRLLPQGGMIHVINKQVVAMYREGLPYDHGRYPFTKFEHIPTGKFYADSVITDLISLQREYNRGRSQIIENKNRMAKLQFRYAIGSIDPTKITTEPGQAIGYKLGLPPPEPMPLQSLPPYVMQDLDRTLMDIEDLTGQHQVSKGQVPPGVTAATAISFLQEKDDSLLSHTYDSVEAGMEDIARQTLSLVVQYWDVPHIVRVAGANAGFDSFMLSGSKLKNGTDIRMEGGSSLPTSRAARQSFIMDLMKMGFIDPNEGLKILEVGGVQKLYENLKVDEAQAQRENIRMKRMTPEDILNAQQQLMQQQMGQMPGQMPGQMQQQMGQMPGMDPIQQSPMQQSGPVDMQTQQPLDVGAMPVVPVNTWDNHDVHIKIHNNYRKTQAFELLSDEVKTEFEKHVNAHLMAVTSAMQEVQNFQQMGGPPAQGPQEEMTEPSDNSQEEGMESPPSEGPPMGGM